MDIPTIDAIAEACRHGDEAALTVALANANEHTMDGALQAAWQAFYVQLAAALEFVAATKTRERIIDLLARGARTSWYSWRRAGDFPLREVLRLAESSVRADERLAIPLIEGLAEAIARVDDEVDRVTMARACDAFLENVRSAPESAFLGEYRRFVAACGTDSRVAGAELLRWLRAEHVLVRACAARRIADRYTSYEEPSPPFGVALDAIAEVEAEVGGVAAPFFGELSVWQELWQRAGRDLATWIDSIARTGRALDTDLWPVSRSFRSVAGEWLEGGDDRPELES